MIRYVYDGPVYVFQTLVSSSWHGETMADTEKKARSNLTYQYKQQTGRARTAKVRLTGDVKPALPIVR